MRILPPYYAAMAIIIALLLIMKHLGSRIGDLSNNVHANDLTAGNILSHMFLVHSWFAKWNDGIESSMWSVAVEWQIYFLFPLLLLPLWRRFGLMAPIIVGLMIGIIPLMIFSQNHNFAWANPWYVGLFAMGMAGAVINFSPKPHIQHLHRTLPWGSLSSTAFGLFLGIALFLQSEHYPERKITQIFAVGLDILIGLAAMCLIVFCTRSAHTASVGSDARLPLALRLLEARWAIRLGAFSYSLYLVHVPMVLKLSHWSGKHFPPVTAFIINLAGIPLILAAAYLFHLAFERRFMTEHRARR